MNEVPPPRSGESEPHASLVVPETHVAIAEAATSLGLSESDLVHRMRVDMIEDLVYAPTRGGWFLPKAAVPVLARLSEVHPV